MAVNMLPKDSFMRLLREGLITKEAGVIDKDQPYERSDVQMQQAVKSEKDAYDVTQFG